MVSDTWNMFKKKSFILPNFNKFYATTVRSSDKMTFTKTWKLSVSIYLKNSIYFPCCATYMLSV